MDVFINLTRNSFGGQESERLVLKVKRWGETECLLWFYFMKWEAETLLETGVLLTAPEGGLTEISYRTQTSSIHLAPPLICSFSDPWGFLSIQEPKRKKKRRSRGGCTGRGLGHKAWVFNTSFQTLVAGLILLLFGLLWYFLSSFMDPWGLFTCDITETLSSQDCVYPV